MSDDSQQADRPRGRARPSSRDEAERMHGLTAPGPSTVGTVRAMRARDVSRAAAPARERHSDGGAGSSGSSPVDS